jgi:phage terminase large subunit-like protein
MDDLTIEQAKRVAELRAKFLRDVASNKLSQWRPYPWQRQFYEAGIDNTERMLMAANGVGKTFVAAAEVAIHMIGDYDSLSRSMKYPDRMSNGQNHPNAGELVWPDGWKGKRFNTPVRVWTGSPTNETSKQNVQTVLLGGTGEELGTGWIPRNRIIGRPTMRQAGVKDVIDSFQVRHISGGISNGFTKTYEQGWQKWQGGAPHIVWLDEEPDDNKIYTESLTRILRTQGILIATLTPLLGWTDLSLHFRDGGDGIYMQNATWDAAPHLDDNEKERLKKSYPAWELDARTKGIPMMGEGAVYPVSDDEIRIDPFKIPGYWARIKGCDFGIDHPAAGVEIAWDREQDVIYVIDCYRAKGESAPYHAAWLNKTNKFIPVAWPHDGMNREKSGGKTLAQHYRDLGVNMLSKSARYPKSRYGEPDTGGGQPVEPIVDEILERMHTGRFKVFSNLSIWFEEKNSYHRKDGKIVAKRDDTLRAMDYAVMMKRYAVAPDSFAVRRSHAPQQPIASARI